MRTVRRSLARGILLIALIACDGDAGPGDPELLATVDYLSRSAAAGALPPPDYQGTAAVSAETGALRFTTTIYGDLCRTIPMAGITEVGGEITFTLRLRAKEEDVNCPQWIAETDVTAHTQALPPGHYGARVVVEYPAGSVEVLDAGSVTME